MMIRRLLPVLAVLLLVAPALAQQPANPSPRYSVECRPPFGREASHAALVKLYGSKNVTFETVNREEGEKTKATILFARDPSRRLEIEWHDSSKRRRPSTIKVFGEGNQWVGPLGIRNGMTIEEIETRAGRPFKINGFGFDVAGAGHFDETALASLPGGCTFGGYFDVKGAILDRFNGEVEIDSNDAELTALKPTLWIYTLTYNRSGPGRFQECARPNCFDR